MTGGDRMASLAMIVMMAILPLSALLARRLPAGRVLRMGAIWVIVWIATACAITVVIHHI